MFWRVTVHMMYMCVYTFRLVVCLAGICTPAQRSSPQMNVPVLHTFLVLYRHPNRPHGPQEVGLSVCTYGVHALVSVVYTLQACLFIILDCFCLGSGGVWPWRKPTFYWRAEPYVSLHCHQLYLQLNIYDGQYVVEYLFPFLLLQSDWQLRFNDA